MANTELLPCMQNSLPLNTEIPFALQPILGKQQCPDTLCAMCAGHEPLWHSRLDENGLIDMTFVCGYCVKSSTYSCPAHPL